MENKGRKVKFEKFRQLNDDKQKEPPKLEIKPLPKKTIESSFETTPINDYFPYQSLFSVTSMPWFANIVNFLATRQMPP